MMPLNFKLSFLFMDSAGVSSNFRVKSKSCPPANIFERNKRSREETSSLFGINMIYVLSQTRINRSTDYSSQIIQNKVNIIYYCFLIMHFKNLFYCLLIISRSCRISILSLILIIKLIKMYGLNFNFHPTSTAIIWKIFIFLFKIKH